ncbi:MAG: HAD-IA family hydrolase, partial [Firmicutes bacterium]|nr:HAD-IA family hydrolase [Bacillota bacterium]
VVIGDFRDKVSYAEIDRVFRMIHNGSKILCTNKGKAFYREDGAHIDTGGFVTMFEYATGKKGELLGKPSAGFFRLALDSLGVTENEAAVVGDDISTDVAGAKSIGSWSVLVKTGKYSGDAVGKAGIRPDFIIDSIASVKDILI